MKRYTILLAIAMLALSGSAYAATSQKSKSKGKSSGKSKAMTADEIRRYNIRRFDIHNIYVWGGVGYSGLIHKNETMTGGLNYTGDFSSKMLGGAGGLIGAGYEYNYKHILFSVGPELRILSNNDRLTLNGPYEINHLDYDQTKRYYLSNVREQQVLTQLMLPMLVGGQWDYLYFKAGFKVGYTLTSTYTQKMDVQGAILDPMAYAEWQTEMPNHYQTGLTSVQQKGTNKFGWDIALSAEVGVNLDQLLGANWRAQNEERERPYRMRAALFMDYGINNMSIAGGQTFASRIAPNEIETQSWLPTEWGPGKLNSLLVGVKFTWMLQMNKVKEEKKLNGYLAVLTIDNQSQSPLIGSTVQVKSVATKKVSKKNTNSRGLTARREPIGDYIISAQHAGYEPITDMAYYHGEDNDTARLAMQKIIIPDQPVVVDTVIPIPVEVEQPIVMDNLFFATNQTTILPESEASLQMLYQILAQHPEIRIRITGHTDNVGSDRKNQILSEGRANSVRQNMIDRGIDPSRIEAEGKGESMPIDTNDTEEGRQNNRRVEFMILQ